MRCRAYMPRQFMSPIHCAPQDSVRVFKDVNAKRAVGMHWGYADNYVKLVECDKSDLILGPGN
jgi:L-ascorbate metabolism protein UlaG (beta-lactamase superfamily)